MTFYTVCEDCGDICDLQDTFLTFDGYILCEECYMGGRLGTSETVLECVG